MPRERVIQVPDRSAVSLLLFEYQNLENPARIEGAVAGRLETVRHDAYPWRDLLGDPSYRPELAEDRYGTVVMVDPATRRLRREGG
jgi:hypothetical protein